MNLLQLILFWAFVIFQVILAIYLVLPGALLIIKWLQPLGGRLFRKIYPAKTSKAFDFAAIITAHQDPRFIPPLVDSLQKQTYRNLVIYIVADDCDTAGLHFNDDTIVLLKPEQALHAKIESIKYALDRFQRNHDALVIFDTDNLAHQNILKS